MENDRKINEEDLKDESTQSEVTEEATDELVEEADVEVLETEEEKLKAENAELKDKLMRSAAEFDNFRKRTVKEKQTIYSDGVKDVVEKLLPVIDNFDRAMIAGDKEDSFYIGMDMIYKQFNSLLTDLGIMEIGKIGDEFDPNYHFAVAKEDNEEFGENQISEILQKGYILKEKVIRPAMVKVAN